MSFLNLGPTHVGQTSQIFNDVTACAETLSRIAPTKTFLAFERRHQLRALHQQQLEQIVTGLQECIASGMVPHPYSAHESTLVVSTYASAVTALVVQLHKFGSISTPDAGREDLHNALWDCLLSSSTAFRHVWPQCLGTDHSAVHTALHALMVWLLAHVLEGFDRAYAPDQIKRASDLQAIMTVPLACLTNISSSPSALCALPPGFLSLLCCITCYSFGGLEYSTFSDSRRVFHPRLDLEDGSGPPIGFAPTGSSRHTISPTHSEFLRSLVDQIMIASEHDMAANPLLLTSLTSPAVFEVCKLLVITCGWAAQQTAEQQSHLLQCYTLLTTLITKGMQAMFSESAVASTPASRARANINNSRTAAVHPPPLSVVTDRLLLETLCERIDADPSCTLVAYQLAGTVMQSWSTSEERTGLVVAADIVTDRILCVSLFARQCTLHVREWMKLVRRKAAAERADSHSLAQSQLQQQQQGEQELAADPHGHFRQELMIELRSVMGHVVSANVRQQNFSALRAPSE